MARVNNTAPNTNRGIDLYVPGGAVLEKLQNLISKTSAIVTGENGDLRMRWGSPLSSSHTCESLIRADIDNFPENGDDDLRHVNE